jgi:hypothetical protein
VLQEVITRLQNSAFRRNSFDCAAGTVVLFETGRDRRCSMREELASYSFLAVTLSGVGLLCYGLVALADLVAFAIT